MQPSLSLAHCLPAPRCAPNEGNPDLYFHIFYTPQDPDLFAVISPAGEVLESFGKRHYSIGTIGDTVVGIVRKWKVENIFSTRKSFVSALACYLIHNGILEPISPLSAEPLPLETFEEFAQRTHNLKTG